MKITRFGEFADPQSINLRLSPVDVGHDLRASNTVVAIAADDDAASYADAEGERWVVEGTPKEILLELLKHGYTCSFSDRATRAKARDSVD